jgi:hypothetical protein
MTNSLTQLERLDAGLLAEVASMQDEMGVLTVVAARGETAAIEIRSSVHRHRHTFAELKHLLPDAVAIADDRLDGVAHAFVAALSTGVRHSFALPAPVETLVAVGGRSEIMPIARAVAAALPVGIVDVGRDGIRLIETGTDGTHELPAIPFEVGGDWSEFQGPAHAQPLRGTESSSQRDLFERRLGDQRSREVVHAAVKIARLAKEHGWATTLVAGDPHLTPRLVPGLHAAFEIERRLPAWESAGALTTEIADELAAARRAVIDAELGELRDQPLRFATGILSARRAIEQGSTAAILVDEPSLGANADDLVRTALAHRVGVQFADGHLTGAHGVACRLHAR